METTIDDMIEVLQEAREVLGGEAEIRVAYQQNYPLRGTIARITVMDPEEDPYSDGERGGGGKDNDQNMLWLAVGSAPYDENPYGPSWAWTGEMLRDE